MRAAAISITLALAFGPASGFVPSGARRAARPSTAASAVSTSSAAAALSGATEDEVSEFFKQALAEVIMEEQQKTMLAVESARAEGAAAAAARIAELEAKVALGPGAGAAAAPSAATHPMYAVRSGKGAAALAGRWGPEELARVGAPAGAAAPAAPGAPATHPMYAARSQKSLGGRWGPEELARVGAPAGVPAPAAPAAPATHPMYAARSQKSLGGRWGAEELARTAGAPVVATAAAAPAAGVDLGAPALSVDLEAMEVTTGTHKEKNPLVGTVRSVKRVIGADAPGEIAHVVLETPGGPSAFPYVEGQSVGVIPPGQNHKGKPHTTRLYSIASTRYGDDGRGDTVSLCVRRARYVDPETGKDDPAKAGICSNWLCDAPPGLQVPLTGPTGKILLLPPDPAADVIMVATGTGIAPFRGFMRRLFFEPTTNGAKDFNGLAWLLLGVPTTSSLLYSDDWAAAEAAHPDRCRITYAISREQQNKAGGKMYIQDRLDENADEIFTRLENGGHIYFCGLKGMMPGITETLASAAARRGIDFEAFHKTLKKNKQWHVEVY